MRISMGVLVWFAALSLAVCSSNPGARAIEGAGISGAAGAVGTAVVGGPVVAGAAVGAAAGAVVGVVTDEDQIDLNK